MGLLKIILKEDIELYRYLIAKLTFLQTHAHYKVEESYPDSNCFLLLNTLTNKQELVSLLKQPQFSKKNPPDIPLEAQKRVFIQNPNAKVPEGFTVEKADKVFNDALNNNIRLGFLAPEQLIKQCGVEFKEDIEFYFKKAEQKILEEQTYFVKYYGKETVEKNAYQVAEGNVSFSHPKWFNDPFDCNCYYADGNTMMDVFRVFCFTHAYDNILMWSYYANSHEGYALQYSYSSLLDKIQGVALDGLCVYGEVEYIDQRPKTRSHSNRFSFSNLNFYIQATFAKFKEWSHEREYRFVFILDNQEAEATNREAEEKLSDWVVLPKVDILQGYAGCQAKKIMKDTPYPIRQLKKDIVNYQLKG